MLSGQGPVSSITDSCGPPLSAYRIRNPSIVRNRGLTDAVSEVFIAAPSVSGCLRSRRQLHAGLLRHHVGGVPVGPVHVVLSALTFFVLAVGNRGATHRVRQI